MKQYRRMLLALLVLGCVLLGGCAGAHTANENAEADENRVYRIYSNTRTTNQWEGLYGAITADGRMVMPIDTQQLTIVSDVSTGEQVWIQTTTRTLEDPNLSVRDLYEGDYWDKIKYSYTLYDLEGNVVKELGENGVSRVCDNLVLYYDGQLADRDNGTVYFDDVSSVNSAGEYYIMTYDSYSKARVTDKKLNILYETEGGFIEVNGETYIVAKENGKSGLQKLDGTVIVPCEYDYFSSYYNAGVPYVTGCVDGMETVISIEDGSILYQEPEEDAEYNYVQYLLENGMIIQTRSIVATAENGGWPIYRYSTQMYGYDGTPMGESYQDLSPYMDLYNAARAEGNDVERLFSATTERGEKQIITQEGEVLYTIPENCWVNVVDYDRIIVHDYYSDNNASSAVLCDMSGTRLNEKAYQNMYALYLEDDAGMYTSSKLINASYTIGGTTLYDVLDADGNVLIERCKSVDALAEDRFWVEKGFSQGLMDREGNWLYEQSVFSSAVDES